MYSLEKLDHPNRAFIETKLQKWLNHTNFIEGTVAKAGFLTTRIKGRIRGGKYS